VISRGYLDRGEITAEQLDAALDVLAMTGGEQANTAQSDDA
jgi:hypothetical protein